MRFYFHTQTDTRLTDTEGTEFDSFVEARRAAIRTCGQMMKDAPEAFWGSRPWSVTVTDANGLVMWEIDIDGQASPASRALDELTIPGATDVVLPSEGQRLIMPMPDPS